MTIEVVTALVSGAALGALVSGLVQFLLARRERRWDREDELRERRRATYEAYLRHVMTILPNRLQSFIETGDGSGFEHESEIALADLRVDAMLVASDDVRQGLQDVHASIGQFGESVMNRDWSEGTNAFVALRAEWEEHVTPAVRQAAQVMSAEINP